MLIIALVLAVIGLAALVFAVVTSNELVAWVCIAASVLGVVLLIVDALRERQRREGGAATKESGPAAGAESGPAEDDDSRGGEVAADHPAETLDDESAPADSESDVEAAENVSDDHTTR
jgi:hypothetical protein